MNDITVPVLKLAGGIEHDSRLRPQDRHRKEFFFRGLRMQRVWCANCGASCGAVTADCPFAFALCDKCESYGAVEAEGLLSIHV